MKILAIYGSGGLGREVLELAEIINNKKKNWEQIVFIDDGNVPSVVNGRPVYKYDEAKTWVSDTLEIVVGIGEPAIRKSLFNKIKNDGIPLPSLVHPDVRIPDSTKLGEGIVIQYGCFVSCNVTIDDYVFVQPQCNIGHDDYLHEGCVLSGFSNLAGAVTIGKYTYIGMSSSVRELVTIGDYSIVGMGSVVHKDIPSEVVAMGNPARPMAKNEERRVFNH